MRVGASPALWATNCVASAGNSVRRRRCSRSRARRWAIVMWNTAQGECSALPPVPASESFRRVEPQRPGGPGPLAPCPPLTCSRATDAGRLLRGGETGPMSRCRAWRGVQKRLLRSVLARRRAVAGGRLPVLGWVRPSGGHPAGVRRTGLPVVVRQIRAPGQSWLPAEARRMRGRGGRGGGDAAQDEGAGGSLSPVGRSCQAAPPSHAAPFVTGPSPRGDRCRTARAGRFAPGGADRGLGADPWSTWARSDGTGSTDPSGPGAETVTRLVSPAAGGRQQASGGLSPRTVQVVRRGRAPWCAAGKRSCQVRFRLRRFRSRAEAFAAGQPAKVSFPVRMSKCGGRKGWRP